MLVAGQATPIYNVPVRFFAKESQEGEDVEAEAAEEATPEPQPEPTPAPKPKAAPKAAAAAASEAAPLDRSLF